MGERGFELFIYCTKLWFPTIKTNLGGIKEMVINHKSGIIYA